MEYARSDSPDNPFRNEILPQWDQLFHQLFPVAIPARAEWRDQQQIISVLSTIGAVANLNHLFHPRSGGSDLTGAAASHEDGLLELRFGPLTTIVSPRTLTCDIFSNNNEWSFFRLETGPIAPTGIYEDWREPPSEEVVEFSQNEYAHRSCWDEGHLGYDDNGDEIPLPSTARIVSRLVSGGPS